MVASYVHHIAAWMDGTESLPDGEYRAYHVVCELIYLNNGPIVMHESGIAGRCNQHVLAFRRNLAKLIERQKLVLGADGKLSNKRAETELKARIKPQANPPQTPERPPPDPPQTPAGPTPRDAAKPLISGEQSAGAIQQSPCESSSLLSSETPKGKQHPKKRKTGTELVEGRANLNDDWPDDYEDLFWDKYPKGRKHDQAAVYGYLFKLRREGFIDAKKKRQRLSWAVLMAGLDGYIASHPGEFAKAPLPWLRGQRWAVTEYPDRGASNGKAHHGNGSGKVDSVAAAAARRFGGGSGNGSASGATGPASSANGMDDDRPRARRGGEPDYDIDLKPGPGGNFRG